MKNYESAIDRILPTSDPSTLIRNLSKGENKSRKCKK